jgi:uncharacterized circularly permuted ATP-grasp superfamily protein/uncharacterized alpha-E superfamily protein
MNPAAAVDEMVDGRGGIRPHWRSLLGVVSGFDAPAMAERVRRLDRAFEEEGVSAVLPGAHRLPWRCDPLPLPLTASEFATLEAGLVQRADLMSALLADICGPLQMLAEGRIPPALIFANPAFLRESRVTPSAPHLLDFYAADLLRGPDGVWRVLADRTSAPAGVGYARENRRLLARVLPELFRPAQVRQLRPFFDRWQEALMRLVPGGNASLALHTPGTAHPQWFEHMFLARELGCALVEGADLTVRDGVVFLKTLRGLQRIDVLVRRLDGRMIDPLELFAGSHLGVTGLMDAARSGAVRIVNDPGSGVLEAPALAACLPGLAMRLLGKPLALESVPTLWLGDPHSLSVVQRDLPRWLVRPAMDGTMPATSAAALSPEGQARLAAEIARAPGEYAATQAMTPSLAPCVTADGLQPRPVVLRMFLVHDGMAWRAMEGGLARVLEPDAGLAGSLPGRGVCKDVWVLHEDAADIVGLPAPAPALLPIRRSIGELPSRVADDFFWMGRYVERLEASARLARSVLNRVARGAPLPHEVAELQLLSACLSEVALSDDDPPLGHTPAALTAMLRLAVRDTGLFGAGLARFGRLVETVRDRMTGEMHAAFTYALRTAREDLAGDGGIDALLHGVGGVQRLATTVAGVAAENMVRGGGWLFLETGRRLERAHAVAGQLALVLDQPPARMGSGLRLALELCDSLITYGNRYRSVLQPAPVLDLVLADGGNPRALAFQLAALETLLAELGGEAGPELAGAARALLLQAQAMVGAVAGRTDAPEAEAARQAPRLAQMAGDIAALSDRIGRICFALLPATQTLGVMTDTPTRLRGAA